MSNQKLVIANTLFRNGDFNAALNIYEEILRDRPEYWRIIGLNFNLAKKKVRNNFFQENQNENLKNFLLKRKKQIFSLKKEKKIKVCLVTEELAGIHPSGGIGAAFLELARGLSENNFQVDILYCNVGYFGNKNFNTLSSKICPFVNSINLLDPSIYTTPEFTPNKISYSIFKWFECQKDTYDFIHFHDYKGLGYYSFEAKSQGIALLNSVLILQIHGPTRWALSANSSFFTHEEQLRFDYMEKRSIEMADYVVAPSQYIINWVSEKSFANINIDACRVIKNCLPPIINKNSNLKNEKEIKTLVYFGRQEERKGLKIFCQALNVLKDVLEQNQIKVVFVGGLGEINEVPSLFYLYEQSKKWNFPFEIKISFTRDEALHYISDCLSPLVCICSPYENSPYAVFEIMHLSIPLISSEDGGAIELFKDKSYPGLIAMNAINLASTIKKFIDSPWGNAELSETKDQIIQKWIDFHLVSIDKLNQVSDSRIANVDDEKIFPLVSVIITHYERPEKLLDAIHSIKNQTYRNIEIIIVDDASRSEKATDFFEKDIKTIFIGLDIKVVRRSVNGYLGAARNSGLKEAKGSYVCFLDDDDYALPTMIDDLVCSSIFTNADAVIAINAYMPETERRGIIENLGKNLIPSYIPTGGPYVLSALENCIGGATSLFKISCLKEMNGYTELYGIGHEDYELYVKMLANKKTIRVCPKIGYLYETGRPSMISSTSVNQNFLRNFHAFIFDERSRDLGNLQIGKKLMQTKNDRIYWKLKDYSRDHISALLNSMWNNKNHIEKFLKFLEERQETKTMFFKSISE